MTSNAPRPLAALLASSGAPQSSEFADRICARVTDDMLEEIARADYGMDYEAHLKALRRHKARAATEDLVVWEPQEVLELVRWSEFGDNRTGQVKRPEQDFHLLRTFCCSVLLESYAEPINHGGNLFGMNQTLAQLLASQPFLDEGDNDCLPAFIASLIAGLPDHEDERAFYGLAWFTSLVRLPRRTSEQTRLAIDVLAATEREVERLRKVWPEPPAPSGDIWLLGWTFYDLRHRVWRALGDEFGRIADTESDEALRAALTRVSHLLTVEGAWRDGWEKNCRAGHTLVSRCPHRGFHH